jgi:ABC-type antimicrobial peptide transport system permease subunit
MACGRWWPRSTEGLTTERLVATLCTVFGALATLLAIIGLYGVVSYSVSQRTREIGIRLALGAGRRMVVTMVMKEALLLVGVGVVVGILASLGLTRAVASALYGVTPHDPTILIVTTIGLTAAATAAGYLPARRASRTDPMLALRQE